MQAPPNIPLQRLLSALPVDYPLDNYPEPWGDIFTALQAAPPFPDVRQAAFKAAVAALPDDALEQLQDHLNDPLTFAKHLKFSSPQARLLRAVAELAPVQVTPLARYLNRDYANTFRAIQKLVSLGLVTRDKEGRRVFYQLSEVITTESKHAHGE